MSSAAWILALAVVGQGRGVAATDPDQFPLALHRSMEVDDLEREIRRQHDAVILKRIQEQTTRRLVEQGAASRGELRRVQADLRYQEAREAEMIAYRAFKQYERDVLGQKTTHDERTSYTLLLNLLKKQEAMALVEREYKAYAFQQLETLARAQAASRQERDTAELDLKAAEANLALSRARQKQVLMELEVRQGQLAPSSAEFIRLKSEALEARIAYHRTQVEGARRRAAQARDRQARGLISKAEVDLLDTAVQDAERALNGDLEQLRALKPPIQAQAKPPA